MSQEHAYTAKGALLFFGVCLCLMGIGGTGTADEEVRAALVSFVSDPAQDTVSRTLRANSSWIAWALVGIGTSMAVLWGVGFVFPSTRSRPEP